LIPANDDANKSIEVILDACCAAIVEGIEERKAEKVDTEAAGEAEAPKATRKRSTKARVEKAEVTQTEEVTE
jgi:small subunit ribosomal protein S2